MRLLIAILALTLACPAFAFDIPVEKRVHNQGNYCTWASIETLGRTHGVEELTGLMQSRRAQKTRRVWAPMQGQWTTVAASDPGYNFAVRRQLDELGVRYLLDDDYAFNRDTLWCYANTHGCVVTLKAGNPHSLGCHSIVVVHYDADIVRFYDSSKPFDDASQRFKSGKPKIWQCNRAWFDQWWAGNAIVILGDEAEGESS